MPFSYSTDEENFTGDFASYEDAAREAFAEDDDLMAVFVGENHHPDPTKKIDGEAAIERIKEWNEEEYFGDWAADWLDGVTVEQYKELDAMLGKAFGEWMDKHNLRPTFYSVEKVKKFTREEVM